MNKILVLLFTIFIITKSKNEIDFLSYHQKFIEVEELIANENFKDAETKLESLLVKYKPSFTKDYIIFSQLCLLNQNKSKAISWIEESMKFGAKLNCLKEIELLNKNFTENEWKKLETNIIELDSIYRSKINFSLGARLNRNYQKEQDSKAEKNYKNVVYSNFKKIKELTDKGTFPGEYLIGIDNVKYASDIPECEFGNSKVIVTLLHYDFPIIELTEEVLVLAIKKGQLHPREFASIFTLEKNRVSKLYGSSYKTKKELPDYNFMFAFEMRKNRIDKVNEDRYTFGICSVETDKKKIEIEKKYGMKLNFGYK